MTSYKPGIFLAPGWRASHEGFSPQPRLPSPVTQSNQESKLDNYHQHQVDDRRQHDNACLFTLYLALAKSVLVGHAVDAMVAILL